MKINRAHAFAAGVVVALLAAAAKFVGGTPLDQTFTYQGQLRNAGQLVNGPVDLRITLWDADVAGGQVGSANTFNAMQLNDGRFACGLNFGGAAFDGSNRWIQVEFRNPAGSGQYQALTPRDKITATPYALYALNGANGVWVYDTNQQAVTVTGKKVGIGTGNPTATLEVVDAVGGDDSVKLPAGSVGAAEVGFLPTAGTVFVSGNGTKRFIAPRAGRLLLTGWCAGAYNADPIATISIDGVPFGTVQYSRYSYKWDWSFAGAASVSAGTHEISISFQGQQIFPNFMLLLVDSDLPSP